MGVAIVLIFVSRVIAAQTQDQYVRDDSKVRLATAERLAPIGKVAVAGEDNSALEQPIATTQAAVADLPGDQAYTMACAACHGAGIAGAPKMSDKTAWSARIAQGMPTLYKHALAGFQGKAGFMPAKGGRMDLSDKTITNAVDHMVAAAK
ncbi:MAG: cytochrome c5 family protein [Candidatus Obscuribacterales bacterium]|nr:cytochrome c5 family protein [Steroidobacteraceae bacterium]